MTPERWHRIGDLFDRVVTVPPAERAGWLNGACDADDELPRRSCSLLTQDAAPTRMRF